jgi:hypothetical protein
MTCCSHLERHFPTEQLLLVDRLGLVLMEVKMLHSGKGLIKQRLGNTPIHRIAAVADQLQLFRRRRQLANNVKPVINGQRTAMAIQFASLVVNALSVQRNQRNQ